MNQFNKLNSEKAFSSIIILIILLIGVVVGVVLSQAPQIYKPKALAPVPENPESSLSLVSDRNAYKLGEKFEVKLIVRSDTDRVNKFKAQISYPKDLLKARSIKTSSSQSFPISLIKRVSAQTIGRGGFCGYDGEDAFYCPAGENCLTSYTYIACGSDQDCIDQFPKGECSNSLPETPTPAPVSPVPSPSSDPDLPDFFITNWEQKQIDDNKGLIRLLGSLPGTGAITNLGQKSPIMAVIEFEVKSSGNASIEVGSDSQIIRSLDNLNILNKKNNLSLKLGDLAASGKPNPSSKPASSSQPATSQLSLPDFKYDNDPGDGNGDGKVNFADLGVLFSNFNKSADNHPELDFNHDGKISFSDLFKLLGLIF